MKTKNIVPVSILGILICAIVAFPTPPYMWYATHAIDNYTGNGCTGYDETRDIAEALGFDSAIVDHANEIVGEWYRFKRFDAAATAQRWRGESAEINKVDFLFFSGHGCAYGPILGCNNDDYHVTSNEDIRFGGNYFLKWVIGDACEWFTGKPTVGMDEFERWNPSFKGVHVVLGHRAGSWSTY